MSIFQCDKCGCSDNTACGNNYHTRYNNEKWFGIKKGLKLCTACTPSHTLDGQLVDERSGKWHNEWQRVFLPKGEFFTNQEGNLEHKETGLSEFEFIKKYPERISYENLIE